MDIVLSAFRVGVRRRDVNTTVHATNDLLKRFRANRYGHVIPNGKEAP